MAALDPRLDPWRDEDYWPPEGSQAESQPAPPAERKRPALGGAVLVLKARV